MSDEVLAVAPAAVPAALRAQRRVHRVAQRALAVRAGVPKSTVARIELGDGTVGVATLSRVLAEVGLVLLVAHEDGTVWRPGECLRSDAAGAVDLAGRRFPAHLPAAPTGTLTTWGMAREPRWVPSRRTPWRYERWSDQVEALVAEMHDRPDGGAGGGAGGRTDDGTDGDDDGGAAA